MSAVPQPKESCGGVEVASTRASTISTCAVSDLEELLPEASLEKLEGHSAGQRAGSGSGRWPKKDPVDEEDATVQSVCGIFDLPVSNIERKLWGIAFTACGF
jgi:hypothetical protein